MTITPSQRRAIAAITRPGITVRIVGRDGAAIIVETATGASTIRHRIGRNGGRTVI